MMKTRELHSDGTHYDWLDFLRFICAFIVVVGHARGFFFVDYSALNTESKGVITAAFYGLTRIGHEAVIAFFVLSGYFVGGRAAKRISEGNFNKSDYAIDRISRVFLPLVPVVIFSALVSGFEDGFVVLLGNVLGLQGWIVPVLKANGPLWSLAYEIWFYFLVYIVANLFSRSPIGLGSLLMLVLAVWVFSCLKFQYLACWCIGALFYFKSIKVNGFVCACVLFIGVLGLQYTAPSMLSHGEDEGMHNLVRPLLEVILGSGVAMLCVILVHIKGNFLSQLSVKGASFSYTLYLTHYPVLFFLRDYGFEKSSVIDLSSCINYAVSVIICLVVSWGFYWFFERHTADLRQYLKNALSK